MLGNAFEFDGRFFRQTCGIAMGTPLAPALATIVIADLKERYLLFAIWSHGKDSLQSFVHSLNRCEPRINFTWQS